MRWSLLPAARPVSVPPDDLAKRGPDFLEQEIIERVRSGPLRWTMVVAVANPGDPTADPSKAWPEGRRAIDVGTLIVQQIQPERDIPCRDINFDPTVLPSRDHDIGQPVPGRPVIRLREVVRPSHSGGQGLSSEPLRAPSHDRGQPTLYATPAPAALAHGGLHLGHTVHRRRHGVYRQAEISDARFNSQTVRDRNSGAGDNPPCGAPALRHPVAPGRPAGADEGRGGRCRITRFTS